MPTDPESEKIAEVFFPETHRRAALLKEKGYSFVHYTNAEVAASILRNKEVWMRNSLEMNDFSEVGYGFQCLRSAYDGESGKLFNSVLESYFPGIANKLRDQFNAWLPDFKRNTFLSCVSEHLPEEGRLGRLSMWRAYGSRTGVALVLKTTPFLAESDVLKAYSSPVSYLREDEFALKFVEVAEGIKANAGFITQLGAEQVLDILFNAFRFSVQCTKHPGFKEEREWRVIHVPSINPSDVLKMNVETIRGVPQVVYKIPLKNIPDQGLVGIEIPELVEKIIIGPTDQPSILQQAFFNLLQDAGVPNPEERIEVSNIPLRHT